MNKLLETISTTSNKVAFQLRKHSPDILVTAGVVGVVASAIMACVATLKLKPVIEEHKETLSDIRSIDTNEYYSEQAKNKDIARSYLKTGWKLTKLYGPSVALGTASIVSILGSHKILTDRNVATAAAYAALNGALRGYRDRVAKSIGEEAEKKIWFEDMETQSVEPCKEDVDSSGGKKKKFSGKKRKNIHPYSRIFDAGNDGWDPNPEMTLYYLKAAETQCQNLLEARGHLFLNEVYDLLGFNRTVEGQRIGWLYAPNETKDYFSHVDFGIYDIHDREKRMFVNGDEQVIVLEFNVDGPILDKFEKAKKVID